MEIYAPVKKVETNNLACVNDEMKCGGTLSIPFEGGEERNKWIKDELKDQALKLFTSANFIDGKPENNFFKVQVDFGKLDAADRKKYFGTKAENPQKLCGCIPKTTTTTTTSIPKTTKPIIPIHVETPHNENEHFSDVIVQPSQPSTQSQSMDIFIIPSLFFFLFLLFIVPFIILTGVNPFSVLNF